ncbi:hypothetical protein JXA02_08655 [candidate division KSB1 bacterium]|nr:hypothetical protein [candidate division KSB1 bacterium]RQW05182.1 MAG: hypothetical protein EH222_10225 [candidate division KSB1 bacterium]
MNNRTIIFAMTLVLGICTASALAQNRNVYGESLVKKSMIDVHAGYLYPRDVQEGMLFGAAVISTFDDAVDIGFGLDIFQKSYSEQVEMATEQIGDTQTTTVATRLDYKRTVLPLYASLKIKMPGLISRRTDSVIFGYFVRASLTYQFLFSEEKNYELNKSENRKYKGFGWQGGVGLYYRVGDRSTLIGEAIYNNCSVNRNITKETDALPQTERVDLSGLGLRLGVELDIR